jgi:hypothetical protein
MANQAATAPKTKGFIDRLIESSRTLSAVRYRVLGRSIIARCRRHLTQRQRVAIGPVRQTPNDAVVGPRVLMVAEWLNTRSKHFDADLFFHSQDVLKNHYDAVIIVKDFDDFGYEQFAELRRRGTRILYSIADNPGNGLRSFYEEPEFLVQVDAVVAASPLQIADLGEYGQKARLIPAPLRNTRVKHSYAAGAPLRVIWQGHLENVSLTEWLHPMFDRLAAELPGGIELVYHANLPFPVEGAVRFVRWQVEDWEDVLIGSDIAIAVKPPDNWFQARKPPTKILTYMAAGLPVICTPSESDKLVIRNGENALIAYDEREWIDAIKKLASDEALRKKMGHAARRDALRFASRNVVGRAHEKLLLSLTGGAGWRRF